MPNEYDIKILQTSLLDSLLCGKNTTVENAPQKLRLGGINVAYKRSDAHVRIFNGTRFKIASDLLVFSSNEVYC